MAIWGLERVLKEKREFLKKEKSKPRNKWNKDKIKLLENSMIRIRNQIDKLKYD
jgi:hypothetical protein